MPDYRELVEFVVRRLVTMPDSVYLRYRGDVYRLNPETGETLAKWKLQAQKEYEENEENPDWGHISVQGS